MLDPRIAARLLDPAALRPAAMAPEEVAAALGPAPLAPELPLLSSSPGTGEAAGPAPEGSPAAAVLLPAAALDRDPRAGADAPPPPSWVAAPELPLAAGAPGGVPGPRVTAGDEAWFEGPSLIEPSALLPSADPAAREPATPGEPAWPSASRPPSLSPSPAPSPAGGDSESLAALAPRLMQAVERLEAVAEALARQAERPPSPMPRPFRGRAVD